jgi:hypothetical protein
MAQGARLDETHPEELITFDDIFALALAEAGPTRFTGDSRKWHEAMYEICERYGDDVPALQEVFFAKRPPLKVQTDQYYQLISTLSTSGLITLPNPNFQYIQMTPAQKNRAKKLEDTLLAEFRPQIQEIAQIVRQRLESK